MERLQSECNFSCLVFMCVLIHNAIILCFVFMKYFIYTCMLTFATNSLMLLVFLTIFGTINSMDATSKKVTDDDDDDEEDDDE